MSSIINVGDNKFIYCTDVGARQITAVPVQNKKIDPMQNCHILISSNLSEWMRCSTWNEIRMNCIPSSMNSRSGLFHSVFSVWTCSSKLDFFLLFQFEDYTVPNWLFPDWIWFRVCRMCNYCWMTIYKKLKLDRIYHES